MTEPARTLDDVLAIVDTRGYERPHLGEQTLPHSRFKLYSAAALDELPDPEWIVEGRIPAQGIVGLIGAKGSLKTFCALDLSLKVGIGLPWQGQTTRRSAAVYVYAEGPFGARARVNAFCQYQAYTHSKSLHRSELPIWFLPTRLGVNNPLEVEALLAAIAGLSERPALVVIDTLNQNLDGDEDGKGMTGFARGCAMIRDTLQATVIAVHHTPLGAEDRGRGHTAFDGTLDTRLIVTRDDDRLTLRCTHQRNGSDGWEAHFQTVPIAGSLALKEVGPTAGGLTGNRRLLLEVLQQQYGTDGASTTAWLTAVGIAKSSFHDARRWLLANSYARHELRKNRVTDVGKLALGAVGTVEVQQ